MAWEEIKSDVGFWKPTIGSELIGVIVEKRDGKFGMQYTIETADKKKIVTPSHKVLQNRLEGMQVGQDVKIVLTGDEAPKVKGQSRTLIYSVFRKK